MCLRMSEIRRGVLCVGLSVNGPGSLGKRLAECRRFAGFLFFRAWVLKNGRGLMRVLWSFVGGEAI